MFTILLALLVAKYGETAFGDKSTATQVGIVAGAIVDITILFRIVGRLVAALVLSTGDGSSCSRGLTVCFLQELFPQSCKLFFHTSASPFSTLLQTQFLYQTQQRN